VKAARIHQVGPPEVVVIDDLSRPHPDHGELLVRVRAAGVGPWDAIIREGKSKVSPPPPLTLGSDLSGTVETIGPGVTDFRAGEEVYGVTNAQFCGAQAEFAVASAGMVAKKPQRLNHVEAASVPVVAVTAWQMLFEHAQIVAGQSVLILGAGGNVGSYAVQLATSTGLDVVAIVGPQDVELVRNLGAKTVLSYQRGALPCPHAPWLRVPLDRGRTLPLALDVPVVVLGFPQFPYRRMQFVGSPDGSHNL
jgi:NADPH:quinone reductase-like Zn-dependent oxidoreductase